MNRQDKNGMYCYEWIGKYEEYCDAISCGDDIFIPYSNHNEMEYLILSDANNYRDMATSVKQFPKDEVVFTKSHEWVVKLSKGQNTL